MAFWASLVALAVIVLTAVVVKTWQSSTGASPGGDLVSSDPKARENARQIMQQTMETFVRDRDRAKAKRGFMSSISTDPSYAEPRFNLAKLEEADEDWDSALGSLRECQKLVSGTPLATRTDEEIRAVEALKEKCKTPEGKRAFRYDSLVADARNFLQSETYGQALASIDEAVRTDTDRFEAYSLAAAVHARMKDYASALKAMNSALAKAPSDRRPLLESALAVMRNEFLAEQLAARGSAAMSEQRYKDAASIYQEAWQTRPAFEGYGLRAALAYQLAGMDEDGLKILRKLAASKDLSVAQAAAPVVDRQGTSPSKFSLKPISDSLQGACVSGSVASESRSGTKSTYSKTRSSTSPRYLR